MSHEPVIGVGSVEFPGASLEKVLQNVQEIGASQVELVVRRNLFKDRLGEAQGLLHRYHLKATATAALTRLNLATFSDIAVVQDLINECIDCAQALNAPFVITYYGVNPTYDRHTSIRLYAEKIKPCLEYAARHNVVILLENLFDLIPTQVPDSFREWYRASDYTRSADACLELLETVNSEYFKLNFDPENFYVGGEEAYPYAYELLKAHIRNVHLKDARKFDPRLLPEDHRPTLQRDLHGDYTGVPLGQGGCNLNGLLQTLRRDSYSGVLTLEAHTRPQDIMETLKLGVQFIRQQWMLGARP